jgi:tetratricopeptide (TPR) repeat protein
MDWWRLLNLHSNVEAISNMAATLLSLNQRKEAEKYWLRSVKLRPSYFEAVEHLVGLLSGDQRNKEAIEIIDFVEKALKKPEEHSWKADQSTPGLPRKFNSGYLIPSSDNGRMIGLIHAKGNMHYAQGQNSDAAKAFEEAIMIATGRQPDGIAGLIKRILDCFAQEIASQRAEPGSELTPCESVLLLPKMALKTKFLVFPVDGQLPGLRELDKEHPLKGAISVTSNSLLSLAKIYQDGMSSNGASQRSRKTARGVQDILALYYLSLSLQPSPSTANNVGILLASVQEVAPQPNIPDMQGSQIPVIPGVIPGSGIALALAYYNYGLNLDNRHAHLYTNLGSLLKDIGQLNAAIKMYGQAVSCDGKFDIALANLANAVKDQGKIGEAIGFYKRAVSSNPDFAEAVCGLANALNSVCSWKGRGGIVFPDRMRDRWHVDGDGMLLDARGSQTVNSGWIGRVVQIVEKQLNSGRSWGRGIMRTANLDNVIFRKSYVRRPPSGFHGSNQGYDVFHDADQDQSKIMEIKQFIADASGQHWEGAKMVRLVERATKMLQWQMYQERYGISPRGFKQKYERPQLPATLAVPNAPTVLPFHTFTCPLTAKQIRRISQRNGLRISCSTLRAPWLPTTMFEPPSPPNPCLNVGYVSSDFNNHPLAHLMQSVFGFHDRSKVTAYCYATTASDNSSHRGQIQREAPVFYDASSWSVDRLVNQIVDDGIHILINLNGYTRGARNEVFAARPAPIQMSFMGFAGTLGAEWCDYLLADETAVPRDTLRPWRRNVDIYDQTLDQAYEESGEDWVYGENIIYTRDTFFCCDHKQSAPDSQEPQLNWPSELQRRRQMRKELFPELPEDMVILGNFNQLYKVFTYSKMPEAMANLPCLD